MFTEKAKLTALAIVHIFETSKPFGDYSVCVVLDDGAGITYGINQFTHKSGSLASVVELFLQNAAQSGIVNSIVTILQDALLKLKNKNLAVKVSADSNLKSALRRAGKLEEMQSAQRQIAFEKYLQPAIEACEGSKFVLPISLSIVYDSINHGSWEKIRDRVTLKRSDFPTQLDFEKAWMISYVSQRDKWLESVPRLKKTAYRTDFFLAQIMRENWQLELPLSVHGYRLTDKEISVQNVSQSSGQSDSQKSAPIVPPLTGMGQTETEAAPGAAENLDDAEKVSGESPNVDDQAQTQEGAEKICKERPSTFVKWFVAVKTFVGSVIAFLGSYFGFDDVKGILIEKAGHIDAEVMVVIASALLKTGIVVGAGVFLVWIASKAYDRAANRANALNLQKLTGAQNKNLQTVDFK